jgi:hypothetical protein
MIRVFLFISLLFISNLLFAQISEAVEEASDETSVEEKLTQGAVDSSSVKARLFPQGSVRQLREDESLDYREPPTVAESLWDRFLRYLGEIISDMINSATETSWGQLFSYFLGVVILVVIILLILRVDAFKVLYAANNAPTNQYNVFDENIHEMDFDREIEAAVNLKDYRRGVRLLFLYALKLLSDRNYISWEQGKTNHDYVAEVREETLRKWLHQLSFYFDYAWYGNFVISKQMFEKVNNIFSDWRDRIR